MKSLSVIADKLLDILFPRHCPLCGTMTTQSDAAQLCDVCSLSLDAELKERCPICRRTACRCTCTPTFINESLSHIGNRQWIAAGFYRPTAKASAANRLVYALKNNTDDTAARVLARILSREVMKHFLTAGENIGDWIITYPPRRKNAIQTTGFDQAQRLAKFCAQMTGAKYTPLFSRTDSKEQKGLDTHGRRINAANTFALKHPTKCRGRNILLCDDILTTGATVAACAALLKDAGAKEVFVIAPLCTAREQPSATVSSDMAWFQNV